MTFKQTLTALFCFMGVTTAYAEHRALLVGIDEYQYISRLIGSKQDVENMKQFIQSQWCYQPWQIRTLTDAQATRHNILKAFDEWLIGGSQPGDKVLFYYSGHGTFVKDDGYYQDEQDGRDEALCPVDAYQTKGGKKMNLIIDDEINWRLQRLRDRQVTIIVDACHSGTITKSAFRYHNTIKVPVFRGEPLFQERPSRHLTKNAFASQETFIENQANIVVYSAVNAEQEALVDISVTPPSGVFTRRFIEGVQENRADSNYDGKVSHRELLAYTRRESQIYCKTRHECMQGLTPQLNIKSAMSDDDIRIWTSIVDAIPPTHIPIEPFFNEDLQVKVLPGYLQAGQRMRVQITSQRNGYLLLFDASATEGAKTLKRIFPNEFVSNPYRKSAYIKAGKSLTIPDSYSGFELIAKSAGKRLMIALLVNNTRDLSILEEALPEAFDKVKLKSTATRKNADSCLVRKGIARIVPTSQAFSQQLSQTLQQTANVTQNGWSLATVTYEINP